ncbi:ATP-binding cassette domain-containing protein [Nonomuraea sp. NPDC026600]|uniref:ATP-binding cassette domain-containing protein n=1 Tax=Nonomuraea sp. NPDC026600 TaxID=3155363 RepID=UPI0033CBB9E7
MTPVLLSLRDISKRFGAVTALSSVSLEVREGEVLALVGDNGAGKSTLIKVMSGVGPADSGTIHVAGQQAEITSPDQARSLGIATVYQDLALCDNLDVAANLFLGQERVSALRGAGIGWLSRGRMQRESLALLSDLSARFADPLAPVASLSGGQRQTIAIARALVGNPRVVLLDEPTAALGVAQTAQVLSLIRRLRDRGLGVILISHNLGDVFAVADRIEVLYLGRNAASLRTGECTREQVVAAITGASDPAGSAERLDASERSIHERD